MQTAGYFMIFASRQLSYATCKCNRSKHFRMDHNFRITQIILIYFHIGLLKLTFRYQTFHAKGNRKAMNRDWSNQKANPAPKTKTGNK